MTNEPLPVLQTKQYLSRIPSRNPMDKLHTNVGHAKSAVNNYFGGYKGYQEYRRRTQDWAHRGDEMEIYEMTENGWKLLYEIKPGDEELPWKRGELQASRDKELADLVSERDKLNATIMEHAIESYKCIETGGLHFVDATSLYYKGFEDGFRMAKNQYDKSGK